MVNFDRYEELRNNSGNFLVPFIEIPTRITAKYIVYEKGMTRLDKVAYDYYGNTDFWWIILQANPTCGSVEFEIKDGTTLRIPYPIVDVLSDYRNALSNTNKKKK